MVVAILPVTLISIFNLAICKAMLPVSDKTFKAGMALTIGNCAEAFFTQEGILYMRQKESNSIRNIVLVLGSLKIGCKKLRIA